MRIKKCRKKGKKEKCIKTRQNYLNVDANITAHCVISLIWIVLTILFMKLFAFLKVTKFQFLVILSENLLVGFERKKKTWLLNSFVFLIPLFAYRVIFSFRMMRTF